MLPGLEKVTELDTELNKQAPLGLGLNKRAIPQVALGRKSAQNRLAVISMVVQCKENVLGLAVTKQAMLEPGLGKVAVMGKKPFPRDIIKKGSCSGAFHRQDGSSAGGAG